MHERPEIGPLLDRIAEWHLIAEQRSCLRRFNLEIRVHDDGGQSGRDRQLDDIGRAGAPDQNESAADRRRDIVAVRRSGAMALTLERTRNQRLR
jgi:hypothetical protein